MAEQYINPRQPDYDNWPSDPDNDIYERKGRLLDEIEDRYDSGELTGWDFTYLMQKSQNFWQLFHFASNYQLELRTEIFTKDLEIEDLKRQLKEKDG